MRLEASRLEIRRGARTLVRELDLRIEPGRVLVVLGPNGAGKSTLLLALAGAHPLAAGWVRLGDRPLASLGAKARAERVAWQGQLPPTEFGLTVGERLQLSAPRGGRDEIDEALRRVDLAGLDARPLGELSAGERQRAELGALSLRRAPLWLLDEPTAHLDLRHQVAWLDLLCAEAARGRSLVVVLHDLGQAAAIADDVLLLYGDGRTKAGRAEEMLRAAMLEDVFGVALCEIGGADGFTFVPSYGEHCASARRARIADQQRSSSRRP
jgi:iron complex transport system ATP-binding protein